MGKEKKKSFFVAAAAASILLILSVAIFISRKTPEYPKELKAYVQSVINRIDPAMRDNGGDPEYTQFKKNLYELKQAYPDKNYEELDEMTDGIETDQEFLNLLKQGNPMVYFKKKYAPVLVAAVLFAISTAVVILIVRSDPESPKDLDA